MATWWGSSAASGISDSSASGRLRSADFKAYNSTTVNHATYTLGEILIELVCRESLSTVGMLLQRPEVPEITSAPTDFSTW